MFVIIIQKIKILFLIFGICFLARLDKENLLAKHLKSLFKVINYFVECLAKTNNY